MSMNPGATTCPVASMTRWAGPVRLLARALIRPSHMATSTARPGAPLPSMTWAPRITRSSIVSLPLLLRLPSAAGVVTSPLHRAGCLSPQPLCYMVVRRERRRNTLRHASDEDTVIGRCRPGMRSKEGTNNRSRVVSARIHKAFRAGSACNERAIRCQPYAGIALSFRGNIGYK